MSDIEDQPTPEEAKVEETNASTEVVETPKSETNSKKQNMTFFKETHRNVPDDRLEKDVGHLTFTDDNGDTHRIKLALSNLPTKRMEEVNSIIASLGNRQPDSLSKEELLDLKRAIAAAEDYLEPDGLMQPAVDDTDRDWHNTPAMDSFRIATRTPSIKKTGSAELVGSAAIHHISSILGGGGVIEHPLVSSGFSVMLRAPRNEDIVDLDSSMAILREEYAWATGGLTLSLGNMVLLKPIVEFILRNVKATTIGTTNLQTLLSKINIVDIGALCTAFASLMFPNGFAHEHYCTNPKCRQLNNLLLRPTRMIVHDRSMLTKEQFKHLSVPVGSSNIHTIEQLDKYRSAFKTTEDLDFVIEVKGEDVSQTVRYEFIVPTLDKVFENVNDWLKDMEDSLIESLTDNVSINARKEHLAARVAYTRLGQYAQWVKRIVTTTIYSDGEEVVNVIPDKEAIYDSVQKLIEHGEYAEGFIKAVRKFIRKSTTSAVVLPPIVCEKCKTINSDEVVDPDNAEEYFVPAAIAVDPLELFFALVTLHVRKLQRNTPA